MADLLVERRAKLDTITFDELLAEQAWFDRSAPTIDLSRYCFVSCGALSQLTAVCSLLRQDGHRPKLVATDPDLRSYLLRAGFFSTISSIADIEPPVNRLSRQLSEMRRGASDMLLEVTRLAGADQLPRVLDQIVDVLRDRLAYHERDAFDVGIAVSEASQNVFHHNAVGTDGFLSMQMYHATSGDFLQIGLADDGIGIRTTLARNPQFASTDDVTAIQTATRRGASEYQDPTRGSGLHHLLRIAYRHGGTVQIRSGQARVRYRMDKKRGWGFFVPAMRGVQIELDLPSKVKSLYRKV